MFKKAENVLGTYVDPVSSPVELKNGIDQIKNLILFAPLLKLN